MTTPTITNPDYRYFFCGEQKAIDRNYLSGHYVTDRSPDFDIISDLVTAFGGADPLAIGINFHYTSERLFIVKGDLTPDHVNFNLTTVNHDINFPVKSFVRCDHQGYVTYSTSHPQYEIVKDTFCQLGGGTDHDERCVVTPSGATLTMVGPAFVPEEPDAEEEEHDAEQQQTS